jgi:hypothetical protein
MDKEMNGCEVVENTRGLRISFFDYLMGKRAKTKEQIRKEAEQTAEESEGEI